jgi:hypothetical protein
MSQVGPRAARYVRAVNDTVDTKAGAGLTFRLTPRHREARAAA